MEVQHCTICFDAITQPGCLPCNHAYCRYVSIMFCLSLIGINSLDCLNLGRTCILEWANKSNTCPLCKRRFQQVMIKKDLTLKVRLSWIFCFYPSFCNQFELSGRCRLWRGGNARNCEDSAQGSQYERDRSFEWYGWLVRLSCRVLSCVAETSSCANPTVAPCYLLWA